tara:strand:+ start:203 stop:883 length:681 start_codon:yes stop_codon:yes gene_type:complete
MDMDDSGSGTDMEDSQKSISAKIHSTTLTSPTRGRQDSVDKHKTETQVYYEPLHNMAGIRHVNALSVSFHFCKDASLHFLQDMSIQTGNVTSNSPATFDFNLRSLAHLLLDLGVLKGDAKRKQFLTNLDYNIYKGGDRPKANNDYVTIGLNDSEKNYAVFRSMATHNRVFGKTCYVLDETSPTGYSQKQKHPQYSKNIIETEVQIFVARFTPQPETMYVVWFTQPS